jgi:hypothetical protein
MALPASAFWDRDPADRQRAVAPLDQLSVQLVEETANPRLLDGPDGDAVNAGSAAVAGDLGPRCPQHVLAVDLVEQRVEPTAAALLGRAVELVLEGADRIEVPGHLVAVLGSIPTHVISLFCWHSWAPPPRQASVKHGPFASRAPLASGGVVLSTRPRSLLRPDPPPSRLPTTSRGSPVIRRPAPRDRNARAGEGFPSSCAHPPTVPLPIPRRVPQRCTPGSWRRPWPSP